MSGGKNSAASTALRQNHPNHPGDRSSIKMLPFYTRNHPLHVLFYLVQWMLGFGSLTDPNLVIFKPYNREFVPQTGKLRHRRHKQVVLAPAFSVGCTFRFRFISLETNVSLGGMETKCCWHFMYHNHCREHKLSKKWEMYPQKTWYSISLKSARLHQSPSTNPLLPL